MSILDKIIENKFCEVKIKKEILDIKTLEKQITSIDNENSFIESIKKSETGIIAEFKRHSPSKKWINKTAKVEDIVPIYQKCGAAAISILTDNLFFKGSLDDLKKGIEITNLPILRKDFIIDEYQIVEAKAYGASAILLIAAALKNKTIKQFAKKAHSLGIEVLLEIHNEKELDSICEDVDAIGINNRNLSTFITNIKTSYYLANKIPSDFLKVSESGISNVETIKMLKEAGFKGFLIGETFMKEKNIEEFTYNFMQQC